MHSISVQILNIMPIWIRRWTTPPAMASVNPRHLRNLSDLSPSSEVVLWLQTYP